VSVRIASGVGSVVSVTSDSSVGSVISGWDVAVGSSPPPKLQAKPTSTNRTITVKAQEIDRLNIFTSIINEIKRGI
jgi:hypothetical protein